MGPRTSRPRIILMLFLTLVSAISMAIHPIAHGDMPYAGNPPNSPPFYPYGPWMGNLQFIVEGTSVGEQNDFNSGTGNLDITDFPLSQQAAHSACPLATLSCTPPGNLYDSYQIVFNHGNTFWGIPFNNGMSNSGTELRLGIAHLINKQNFVTANTQNIQANPQDCFSPPVQGLPCSGLADGNVPAWGVCNWDPLTVSDCGSAYHRISSAENMNGTAPIGSSDFCAAETHFLNAFQSASIKEVSDSKTNCILNVPGNLGTIYLWFPTNDQALTNLANDLAGNIIHLMGNNQNSVTECPSVSGLDLVDFLRGDRHISPGSQVTVRSASTSLDPVTTSRYLGPQVVANNCPSLSTTTWNIIVGGWSLDRVIDQYYWFYNSGSSPGSNVCLNPFHYCRADYDYWSNMMEFNSTYYDPAHHNDAQTSASAAQYILGSTVASIPIYNHFASFEYAIGWQQGMINEAGSGIANKWTSLNAWRPDPTQKDTIRWGLGSTINQLNPFLAQAPQELSVLSQIYDTLLAPSPFTDQTGFPTLFNWMVTGATTTSYSSTEVSCLPNNTCVTGTTTLTWQLRPDLYWHDGQSLTTDDVVYTMLAYRDAPSIPFGWAVSRVASAVALNPSRVQIKLQSQSPFYNYYVGSIPILPKHVWYQACPPPSYSPCTTGNNFDPMLQGMMVGSGPWRCDDIFLVNNGLAGPCSETANATPGSSALGPGGRILLHRYERYSRCCPNLQGTWFQKFSWADKFDDGIVTIGDLGDIALYNKQPNSYWAHPLYSSSGGSRVDIGDIGTVALYKGVGLIDPYGITNTPNMGIPIDPFRIDFTMTNIGQGDLIEYYLGLTYSSTNATLALATLHTDGDNYYYLHISADIYYHGTSNHVPGAGTTGQLDPRFSSPDRVIFAFQGLTQGDYDVKISYPTWIPNQGTVANTLLTIETK